MEKQPDLECDIVMKGGITSGVVYPGAVLALKDRYRFRSIGGTSAGGIAAAVVAAAEHNRTNRGYDEVRALSHQLTTNEGFLLSLFKPEPATQRLFAVLLGLLRGGAPGAVRAAVRGFWQFPLLALVVAAMGAGATIAGAGFGWLVAGLLAAVLILVAGTAWSLVRAALRLPETDFGLARLGPDAVGSDDGPALTAWLHARIQGAAGRSDGPPLTFADLWGAPPAVDEPTPEQEQARHDALVELSRNREDRRVDLQMMTTNLTYARPMRLPAVFQKHEDRLEDGGALLFEPVELARFFPADVMKHLERFGTVPDEEILGHLRREAPGRTFLRFPIGPDLPVLVATRMTLSYPVLISAVPLWQLDFRANPDAPPLRRVVFSDGGITSNFPVHFFDSPLPRRPTFGLDLTKFPEGEQPDPEHPEEAIVPPDAPNATSGYEMAATVDSVGAFAGAILNSLQNWRDNAQARLPGFRERIVHIEMAEGEGGLNLTMGTGELKVLDARGRAAGECLLELFAPDAEDPLPPHWNDHRYVRWRSTMSGLDQLLRSFHRGYTWPPGPGTQSYEDRIAEGARRAPYQQRTDAVRRAAVETTRAYCELGDPRRTSLDDAGVPRPPSVYRPVPPV